VTKSVEELQSDLFNLMEEEIRKDRLDKAVELAISCYFLSKGQGAVAEGAAMMQIQVALSALAGLGGKDPVPACSFCGRSGVGVKLAAGHDAYICDECVSMLANEVFKTESRA
jgi:hypothetical protein